MRLPKPTAWILLSAAALGMNSVLAALPQDREASPQKAPRVSAKTLRKQWSDMRARGYRLLLARVERPQGKPRKGYSDTLPSRAPWLPSEGSPFAPPKPGAAAGADRRLVGSDPEEAIGYWVWSAPAWWCWQRREWGTSIAAPYASPQASPPKPGPVAALGRATRLLSSSAFAPMMGEPGDAKTLMRYYWFFQNVVRANVLIECGQLSRPRALEFHLDAPTDRISEVWLKDLRGRELLAWKRSGSEKLPKLWRLPLVHAPWTTAVRFVVEPGPKRLGVDSIAWLVSKDKRIWTTHAVSDQSAQWIVP